MKGFLRTSKKNLVLLAALVWIFGGIMLFRGGLDLVRQAGELAPGSRWPWLFILLGTTLGAVQAATIFRRSCRRNLSRIGQLPDPRLWQFFRPGFFLALAGMISAGVLLDHLARGHFFFTLAVAGLDFALTISLLGSSYLFWTERSLALTESSDGMR